jgi:hypothetical protein
MVPVADAQSVGFVELELLMAGVGLTVIVTDAAAETQLFNVAVTE